MSIRAHASQHERHEKSGVEALGLTFDVFCSLPVEQREALLQTEATKLSPDELAALQSLSGYIYVCTEMPISRDDLR